MSAPWTNHDLARVRELVAKGMAAAEIANATARSRKGIITAVKRYDLGPWLAKPGTRKGDTRHIPADFAERWQSMSLAALGEHYGRRASTVGTWAKRLGLSRPTGIHVNPRPKAEKPVKKRPLVTTSDIGRAKAPNIIGEPIRDMSASGRAADYLRRYGPVFRRGGAWCRGTTVLSDAELIERAVGLGWVL